MAEPRFEFSRKQLKCQQGILITCTETAKLLTKTRPHFNNCHRPGVGLLVSDAISSRSASEIPFSLFSFFYSLGPSGSTVCAHCTTPSCIPKIKEFSKRDKVDPLSIKFMKTFGKKMVTVKDQDQETWWIPMFESTKCRDKRQINVLEARKKRPSVGCKASEIFPVVEKDSRADGCNF